jgi:hypothetical protein
MPRPRTVLDSISTAIKESDRLPSATSYSIYEIDNTGGQANVRPPVVEITAPDVIRADRVHTDFVGFATDNQGNHIGRIYEANFEMTVEIDIWTAEADEFNADSMGRDMRTALYRYDARQRADPLPDPDDPSQSLDGVTHFWLDDGGMRNDLTMTPALRRWRTTADVWFHETINTAEAYGAEDYIATVELPDDAEGGTDGRIVFDATDSIESPADDYTN